MASDSEFSGTQHRLLDAVLKDPGITKSELQEVLGIGWGTTDYHVRALENQRLIQKIRIAPRVHLFDAQTPEQKMAMMAALRLPMSKAFVDAMRYPVRAQDLVDDTGASRQVVDRHLAHLTRSGVVERRKFRYSISKAYRAWFER
ncbi:MAG: winged helix-turn-helix transcriptional regulator [Thermoplasmatota archaeon]